MYLKDRFEKLFKLVPKQIDAVLIMEGNVDKNFLYLTDAKNGVFEGCSALLSRELELTVFTPKLEEEAIRASCREGEIITIESGKQFKEILEKKLNGKTIGLNFENLSVTLFEKVKKFGKPANIAESLHKARMIKDGEEVKRIETAQKSCLTAFQKAAGELQEGMTETHAAGILEFEMRKQGIAINSFPTITAFGENSSMPHYQSGEKELEKNDVALFDFGGIFENYCSDATRTLLLGKPREEIVEMKAVVEEAKQTAFELVKPGVKASEVDKVAREVIDKTKFKGTFIHSLGHSVGLDVHDGTMGLSPGGDFELKEGMVLTIEPGVYVPKVGGYRSEDIIVVTKKGAKWLY